jgi:cellulose synthase/poly-beta-1,6-N-acetylglucosamine synthase-like glycosyltransferase
MISAMVKDPEVMGLCGETKIANKTDSWVTMIQVFEYVLFCPSVAALLIVSYTNDDFPA